MHPITAHALDVAAVAVLLPRHFRLDVRALGFLVALHDIGKFSRPFQAQASTHWPTVVLGSFPNPPPPPGPRHDVLGLFLMSQKLTDQFEDVLPLSGQVWLHEDRDQLWRALAGHHGSPAPDRLPTPPDTVLCDKCIEAAAEFVVDMRELLRPPSLPGPAVDRDAVLLGWNLAGLTTLADWVGSRQEWFPYVPADALVDPAQYFWNHAIPRAAAALSRAGLTLAQPAPFAGLRGLFPAISAPSQIQQWAETVAMRDWSDNPSENEVLIQRGAQYRVIGHDAAGGYYEVELLDESDPDYIHPTVH